MLVLFFILISRLIHQSGLRIFNSKVFSSGCIFRCCSMKGLIKCKHSVQNKLGKFLAILLYSAVPAAVRNVSMVIWEVFNMLWENICFHELLFLLLSNLLNQDILKDFQLEITSGKLSPPWSSDCFASFLLT